MEQTKWKQAVGGIRSAILIYTLAGIALSIAAFINSILSPISIMETIQNIMEGGMDDFSPSGFDAVKWILSAAIIGGYIYFYSSISKFVEVQTNEPDRESAGKIKTSYTILIVAYLIAYIPLFGNFIRFILVLVAYCKQRSGYRGLAESQTLPPAAKSGARLLRSCTGWLLASVFISWIPLIGSAAEGLILLITFFQILKAWKIIGDNEAVSVVGNVQNNEHYCEIISMKSDEELKEIASSEQAYDPELIAIARYELTERTLGRRKQMTQEEINARKAELERQRIEEEEQKRIEREEQKRLQKEREEQLRIEQEVRRQNNIAKLKKASPFIAIGVVLIVIGSIILYRNTPPQLVERGLKAYEKGNTEKAVKLIERAEAKGYEVGAWETLYKIYDETNSNKKFTYMKQLADVNYMPFPLLYGMHLVMTSCSSEEYIPYIRTSCKYYNNYTPEEYKTLIGRAAYIMGNYAYENGELSTNYGLPTKNSYWERAVECGCDEAYVRLGDMELACGHISYLSTALEYYKKAPQDIPGVKEKIEIISQMLESNPRLWRTSNNGGHYASYGNNVWGYFEFSNGNSMYGKFGMSQFAEMIGIPKCKGIFFKKGAYGARAINVGNIISKNNYWNLDGEGIYTDTNGDIRIVTWENGQWKKSKFYSITDRWK